MQMNRSPVEALTAAFVEMGTPPKPARALAEFNIELMDRARPPRNIYVLTRADREKLLLLQELAWGEANPETKSAKMLSVVWETDRNGRGGLVWKNDQ
jgi:hypothetical protein